MQTNPVRRRSKPGAGAWRNNAMHIVSSREGGSEREREVEWQGICKKQQPVALPPANPRCVRVSLAKSAVKILKIFHEDFHDFLRILHQFLSVGNAGAGTLMAKRLRKWQKRDKWRQIKSARCRLIEAAGSSSWEREGSRGNCQMEAEQSKQLTLFVRQIRIIFSQRCTLHSSIPPLSPLTPAAAVNPLGLQ